ncbi:MAG: hypothetical protein LM632_12675 [Armatimonadetes bacterium]|nr:hypothetical protein [Armatimonadota bacterium]
MSSSRDRTFSPTKVGAQVFVINYDPACRRVGVQACIMPLALASEGQGARDKGHGI